MHPMAKFLLALATLIPLAFFLGAIEEHGAFSEESAAWAQAIGTVAAIAVAIWTSRSGTRIAMAQADDALFQRALAIQVLFDQLEDAVRTAEAHRREGDQFDAANFDSISDGLKALTLSDMPSANLWTVVIQARRSLHFYREALQWWEKSKNLPDAALLAERAIERHAPYLMGRSIRVREICQELANQLDDRWRREFGGREHY